MSDPAKEKRAQWREKNLAAIKASGVPFTERPEALLFREQGKPRVDFYPNRGSWRVVGSTGGFLHHGEAEAFLAWYRKQRA